MLEMDLKGNMYFHWNFLFCKDDIIKRLVNGTYNLVRPMSQWGMSFHNFYKNKRFFTLKILLLKSIKTSKISGLFWIRTFIS